MKTLLLLPLLLPPPSSAQSPFSPFSLLGSFFSSSPPWAKVPPTPRHRKPQKIFFRPHLPVPPGGPKLGQGQGLAKAPGPPVHQGQGQGPAFSASQQVSQVVQRPPRPRPSPPAQPRAPHRAPSPVSPTQIIRITSPSNFSLPSSTPPPTTSTTSTLRTIVSNSLEEQVAVVYPSNSLVEEVETVTEQTSFSSYPSRESIVSGPNPEEFPIISLIDQTGGHNYYDEVFHLGLPSPPPTNPSARDTYPYPNPSNPVVNPYYSPEEFYYNQDPIDLDLVHGTGPHAPDTTNLVTPEARDPPSSQARDLPASQARDLGPGTPARDLGPEQSTSTEARVQLSSPKARGLGQDSANLVEESRSQGEVGNSLQEEVEEVVGRKVWGAKLATTTSSHSTLSSAHPPTTTQPFTIFTLQPTTTPPPSPTTSASPSTPPPPSTPYYFSSPASSLPTTAPPLPSSPIAQPLSSLALPSPTSSTSFSYSTFSSPSISSSSSPSTSSLSSSSSPSSSSFSSPSISSPSSPSTSSFSSNSSPSTSSFSSPSSPSSSSFSSPFSSSSSSFSSPASPSSPSFPSSSSPSFSSSSPSSSPTFSSPSVPTLSSLSPRGGPLSELAGLGGGEGRRVRLVTTVEYRREGREEEATNHTSLALAACGPAAGGWCPVGPAYPRAAAARAEADCRQVVDAYRAVVTTDIDQLGDNSPSVISSEKDRQRPWSWKVYAYKKRQVCDSQLGFAVPGLAQDTEGTWRTILQTASVEQSVALDTCLAPDAPCPGLAGCGRKSRCVQRYTFQLLLVLPDTSEGSCPSLRAFRFPSACVCHAETQGDHEANAF